MGKSVRNNGHDNGFDFDAAFSQAVADAPIDTKPKNGKQQELEKKPIIAKSGFNFDDAFESAVKKKEGTTNGEESGTGTTNISPSKSPLPSEEKKISSPFDFKRQIDNGGLAQVSQELRAQRNFENKKLTEDDVDLLAPTQFGAENGLNNVAKSTAAKKYFISAHNGIKETDLIKDVSQYLPEDKPELTQPVLNGDVNAIKTMKDYLTAGIDSQLSILEAEGYGEDKDKVAKIDPQIKVLKDKRAAIENSFNIYAQNQIISKRLNLIEKEGTEEGLSAGTLAKELGKQIEKEVYPDNYFNTREQVYTQHKMFPLIEKDAKAQAGKLPEYLKSRINENLKTLKDNQLYAKENIEYDRENLGLNAIMQNISMKANDLISKGISENDPELIKKGSDLLEKYDSFKNQKGLLLDKYPDVGIAQTAQILSDRLSTMNHRGWRSDKGIQAAAAIEEKETGQFLQKYGKFINYVRPEMLPKGGLNQHLELGGEAIGNQFFGQGTDLEEIVRSYQPGLKTTAASGGQPTKIAYDVDGKAYREMDNENYNTWDFNNSMRVMGHGLPSLAEFIILERGVGAIAGLAGEAGVGTLTKISQEASKFTKVPITAEELAATREALRFSKGFKETLGLAGAMYITGYDQNRKLADDLIEGNSGKDEYKKDVLANAITLLSVAAFKTVGYSPSQTVQQAFSKGIMPDVFTLIEKEGLQGLSKEETGKVFQDVIVPKAQAMIKSLGVNLKGGAKAAGAVVLDENVKGLLASIVNPEKGNLPTAQDDVDSAISQIMLMTAAGLPGMVSAKTHGTLTKDAMYEAGLRAPQFEGLINKGVEDGRYTQAQANDMISILKTIGQEAYKAQSETTENGLPLTVKQKRDLAFNNFKVRAAKMLEEKGQSTKSGSVESEVKKQNNDIKNDPRFEEVNVKTNQDGTVEITPVKNEEGLLTEGKIKTSDEIEKELKVELGDEKSQQAASQVKELIDNDLIPEKALAGSKEDLAKNPIQFLKFISEQAQGETEFDGKKISTRGQTIEKYGEGIVAAAEDFFPNNKTQSNGSKETAQEGNQISQAAQKEGSNEENAKTGVLSEKGAAETQETETAPNKQNIEEKRKQEIEKLNEFPSLAEGEKSDIEKLEKQYDISWKDIEKENQVQYKYQGKVYLDGAATDHKTEVAFKKAITDKINEKYDTELAKTTPASGKEISPSGAAPISEKPKVRVSAEEMEAGQPPKEISDELPFGPRGGGSIGISHESQERRSSELSDESTQRGQGVSAEETVQHGRLLLEEGKDPQKAADEFKRDGKISYDAISLVRAKNEELARATNKAIDDFGENSKEAKAAIEKEGQWRREVVKPMQTEWHKIGQAQQGETDIDTGSFIGLKRAFQNETGKDFSSKQAEEAKELSGKVKKLTNEVETLKTKLSEALDSSAKEEKGTKSSKEKRNAIADKINKIADKIEKFGKPDLPEGTVKSGLGIDVQKLIADAMRYVAEGIREGKTVHSMIMDAARKFSGEKITANQLKQSITDNLKDAGVDSKEFDVLTRFVDKEGNKFTPEEAKDIWDYAKTEYLNKGKSYYEMLKGVSMDLGLTPQQVRYALEQPKGAKVITDEMYRKQLERRKAIQRAKIWVKQQRQHPALKYIKAVPQFFFEKAIFGHGTVGMITHSGAHLFRPSDWATYFTNFGRQFKNAFGGLTKSGSVAYEKRMEDLTLRPNFILAKRAGLANDPNSVYDDYGGVKKFFGKLGLAGDRGFNALKEYRQDLFDGIYNKASAVEKADPEYAKTMATMVNHSTGTSKIPVPEGIGVAIFAPRLEASRWSRLIVQPAKAIGTLTNWKNSTPSQKAAAKIVVKRTGEMFATYAALLAANQGMLIATGSKQRLNLTNPSDSDWFKFKLGGENVDVSGGMVSTMDFMAKLVQASRGDKRELKQDKQAQAVFRDIGKYGRGKLSPFGSTAFDFFTHHDFSGNTVPGFNDKPDNRFAHKMTWMEYLTQRQTPIPVSEAFVDIAHQMEEKGMERDMIGAILHGIFVGVMSGGTGARITGDYKVKK